MCETREKIVKIGFYFYILTYFALLDGCGPDRTEIVTRGANVTLENTLGLELLITLHNPADLAQDDANVELQDLNRYEFTYTLDCGSSETWVDDLVQSPVDQASFTIPLECKSLSLYLRYGSVDDATTLHMSKESALTAQKIKTFHSNQSSSVVVHVGNLSSELGKKDLLNSDSINSSRKVTSPSSPKSIQLSKLMGIANRSFSGSNALKVKATRLGKRPTQPFPYRRAMIQESYNSLINEDEETEELEEPPSLDTAIYENSASPYLLPLSDLLQQEKVYVIVETSLSLTSDGEALSGDLPKTLGENRYEIISKEAFEYIVAGLAKAEVDDIFESLAEYLASKS